jgi:hypothetical protein
VSANGLLKKQTQDLLSGLGNCRTEVAEEMRRLGIRAAPRDPHGCAIAVYLTAVLGADLRVRSLAVESAAVRVRLEGSRRIHWPRFVTVRLPEPVREFIVAFDQALYPAMIRAEGVDEHGQPETVPGSAPPPRSHCEQQGT